MNEFAIFFGLLYALGYGVYVVARGILKYLRSSYGSNRRYRR